MGMSPFTPSRPRVRQMTADPDRRAMTVVPQFDTPLGGQYDDRPLPYFIRRDEMRLSGNIDNVVKGVCFVGVEPRPREFTPTGTAFLAGYLDQAHWFHHLITARHVIEQIAGDLVHLRLNLSDGSSATMPVPKSQWVFHPNVPQGQYVDIAVLPFNKPANVELMFLALNDGSALTQQNIDFANIGIGTETFTVGLFVNHYGEERNIPLARFGAISMMPQEPMWTEYGYMKGYLVESHSLGGSSGSPVFATPGLWRLDQSGNFRAPNDVKEAYFMGAVSGHWAVENPQDIVSDDPEHRETARINTGMCIVTPLEKILETVNHPDLIARRSAIIENLKKQAKGKFVMDSAKPKAKPSKTRGDENPNHREEFDRLLTKASQPVKPKK